MKELIVPYKPQQNGVAKRKNKFIFDIVKSLIHDKDLKMCLWENACKNKTPREAFTSLKPRASQFHAFGCPMYIHVPKEKRTKMEPLSIEVIFVVYSEA